MVHRATAVHRQGSKPAVPRIAERAPPAKFAKLRPAGDAAVHSEPAPDNVAASPPADDGTATSKAGTVQEQVAAATAPAEQVTAASTVPVQQQQANNAEASPDTDAVHPSDTEPTVPAPINTQEKNAEQAVPLPPSQIAKLQPAGDAAVHSEPAPDNVAASPPADDGTATAKARTVQEQVAAATALAEHVTAASAVPVPKQEANNAEASLDTKAIHPSDTELAIPAPINKPDNLVALLMARPEIKSVSDLSGRDVAIEEQLAASSASIRAAIASTGTAEVQLKVGTMKAIDRLIGGEVPAAVLTLISPEAAESFPDIPGYSILRIPLSPGSLKPRP
jgi:hypothetical protein